MPRSSVPHKRHLTDRLGIYKRDRATDEPGMPSTMCGPAFQPGLPVSNARKNQTRLCCLLLYNQSVCLSDLHDLPLFLLLVFLLLCDLDSEMRHIVWPLKPFLHEFLLMGRKFPSPHHSADCNQCRGEGQRAICVRPNENISLPQGTIWPTSCPAVLWAGDKCQCGTETSLSARCQ